MKTIEVPKIIPANNIDEIFANLQEHAIDCCNWREEYPYTPKVDTEHIAAPLPHHLMLPEMLAV